MRLRVKDSFWLSILFFLLTVAVPTLGKLYVDHRVQTDILPLQKKVILISRDLKYFMRSLGIEPLPDHVEQK